MLIEFHLMLTILYINVLYVYIKSIKYVNVLENNTFLTLATNVKLYQQRL